MATEWHDLVTASLSQLGSLLHQPPSFLYQQQCSELIRQVYTKFAKFWIIHHTEGIIHVESPDFQYLQQCPQALKEVHRVLKHALSFLQACTGENWLKTALFKVDTNEALLWHVHDLLWCIVGLDVCLHRAKGNSMESCSELLARRVRDCNQELESLAGKDDLLQQDVKQLLAELRSIVGEVEMGEVELAELHSMADEVHHLEQDEWSSSSDEVEVGKGNFRGYMCCCLPSRKGKIKTQSLHSREEIALQSLNSCEQIALHSLNSRQQIALHTIRTLAPERVDLRCFGVISEWDIIGRGGFSAVSTGSWLGLPVALKKCHADEGKRSITTEVYRAREVCCLRHPFVLRTLGISFLGGKRAATVTELMSRDLGEEIRQVWKRKEQIGIETEGPFPLAVAVDIMLQISRGVEYLHEFGVMHRDIKPHNILVEVCEEALVRIRISDFGISIFTAPETIRTDPEFSYEGSVKGTMFYIAPEYVTMGSYSWKSDVYSFAITCSEILTGLSPFEGVQLISAKMKQFIIYGRERPVLPMNCPPPLVAFIGRCWDKDPAQRPNFRKISSFLRHVKLVLMRVDDPKDFMLGLTEFDREEFERHLKPSPLEPSEVEGSFRDPPLASDSEGSASDSEGSSKREEEKAEDGEISEFLSSVRNYKSDEDELSSMPNFIWRMSLKDLSKATNNFSRENRLGTGGYAAVYKGVLPNGMEVAVKRLNVGTKVFGTEARASAKVTHPNVIRLLGLCDEDGIKLLVYEFMVRGSLEKVLFGGATAPSTLNWKQRCKIALGIARGLAYLHEDCEDCILHFDVKAGNILLDRDLHPKLCDFGLSELVERTNKTFISIGRRGTRGYMAPELKDSLEEGKKITDRADVYSFGMLLFEIVRGRPNIQNGCSQWTPREASKMLDEGRVVQMMDPHLLRLPHQEIVRQQVKEVVRIALQSTCEEHPESRPPMHNIVLCLTPLTQ